MNQELFLARYASLNGNACSDDENITKILNNLKNSKNRNAKMVCSLCFINKFGKIFTVKASCLGKIATSPVKFNGFGYNSIFMVNGKRFSFMSTAEKAKISHRGKAIKKLSYSILNWWFKQ